MKSILAPNYEVNMSFVAIFMRMQKSSLTVRVLKTLSRVNLFVQLLCCIMLRRLLK